MQYRESNRLRKCFVYRLSCEEGQEEIIGTVMSKKKKKKGKIHIVMSLSINKKRPSTTGSRQSGIRYDIPRKA